MNNELFRQDSEPENQVRVEPKTRRPRADLSTMKAVMHGWRESGLPVVAYCRSIDLAPSAFYRWRKLVDRAEEHAAGGFIPLKEPSLTSHSESSTKDSVYAGSRIDWQLPDGFGKITGSASAVSEIMRCILPSAV